MKTWTLTWETMAGEKRTTKLRAESVDAAVNELVREFRVGNLFQVRDSRGRKYL